MANKSFNFYLKDICPWGLVLIFKNCFHGLIDIIFNTNFPRCHKFKNFVLYIMSSLSKKCVNTASTFPCPPPQNQHRRLKPHTNCFVLSFLTAISRQSCGKLLKGLPCSARITAPARMYLCNVPFTAPLKVSYSPPPDPAPWPLQPKSSLSTRPRSCKQSI